MNIDDKIGYIDTVNFLRTKGALEDDLTHFSMGLMSEWFEMEESKGALRKLGGLQIPENSKYEFKLELGDILFYAYAAALRIIDFVDSENEVASFTVHYEPELFHGKCSDTLFAQSLIWRDFEPLYQHYDDLFFGKLCRAFLDLILKSRYHGAIFSVKDAFKILRDIIGSVITNCQNYSFDLEEVMQLNMQKLWKRHPEGFRGVGWKNPGSR